MSGTRRAWRRWAYGFLLLALTASGAGAWRGAEMVHAASDQARVYDAATAWSIMQARYELERFRETLARHVAGDPGVSYDDVRERFDILWSRMPLLTKEAPIAVEIDGLTLAEAQAEAEGALRALDPELSGRDSARGDLALLERVAAALDPVRERLARCTTGFVLTRQRLFDETRRTILAAERLHDATFAGFLAVTVILLALALSEATIARRAEAAARRAEAAAVASEQRFRHFAHSASDWLWETDADLRVTFVSERWRTIPGLGEADILGRPLTEVAEPVEEAAGQRARGGPGGAPAVPRRRPGPPWGGRGGAHDPGLGLARPRSRRDVPRLPRGRLRHHRPARPGAADPVPGAARLADRPPEPGRVPGAPRPRRGGRVP